MIVDFSSLEPKNSTSSAFVGIKKDSDKYVFYLPIGYPEELEEKEEVLKTLFFQLYSVMKKYKQKPKEREDGVESEKDGTGGKEEKDKPIFFDNLNIDDLISTYEDSLILGFNTKMLTDDEINYDFNLEDVFFTKNHEAVVIESQKDNAVLSYDVYDIVNMYSFIIYDIHKQMGKESSYLIKQNAKAFVEKYLYPNASFFGDKDISEICKDILYKIHKQSFHSYEYNTFYDKVYKFLYAQPDKDGTIMGIDNFHSIWEEICQSYVFKHYKDDVLYADYEKEANLTLQGYTRMYAKEPDKDNYPFKMTYGNEGKYLYPDLVYQIPIFYYAKSFVHYSLSYDYDGENIITNIRTILKKRNIEKCYIIYSSTHNYESANNEDKSYYSSFPLVEFFICNGDYQINEIIHRSHIKMNGEYCRQNFPELGEIIKNEKDSFINDLVEINNLNIVIYGEENSNSDKIIFEVHPEGKKLQLGLDRISLIDYKYKIKPDIDNQDKVKQKFYELAYGKDKVSENKFVLPIYKKDNSIVYQCEELDNGLSIEYWNMKKLFEEYLDD